MGWRLELIVANNHFRSQLVVFVVLKTDFLITFITARWSLLRFFDANEQRSKNKCARFLILHAHAFFRALLFSLQHAYTFSSYMVIKLSAKETMCFFSKTCRKISSFLAHIVHQYFFSFKQSFAWKLAGAQQYERRLTQAVRRATDISRQAKNQQYQRTYANNF